MANFSINDSWLQVYPIKMKVEGVYQLDIYNFYVTNLNEIDQIKISHKVVNKHCTVLICYQAG